MPADNSGNPADNAAGEITGPGAAVAVGSEFAQVDVSLDNQGNGPRLRLADLRTGRVRYLDALELETVIWLPEGHLRQLLDPAADRWREHAEDAAR